MPISPLSSIKRSATRLDGEPLNILTFCTHERYESLLAKTGHNFYAYMQDGIKTWNTSYAELPDNYTLLNPDLGSSQIPLGVDFDLVLSQNKFGQFQVAHPIARQLHLPLISLEHTLPVPHWPQSHRQALKGMKGHVNIFISEYSLGEWDWDDFKNTVIIHHGVDCEKFKPLDNNTRDPHCLSVVNDWINRDWCCGFQIWKRVSEGFETKVLGDTPGLSEPAGLDELVDAYQTSRIFLNTSTISPIPTSLLEAMACGCAVVSTATCMIPEIIKNGVNGFVTNDENKMREYIELLLSDEELAADMGRKAAETIRLEFSEDKFIENWNSVFHKAANITYKEHI